MKKLLLLSAVLPLTSKWKNKVKYCFSNTFINRPQSATIVNLNGLILLVTLGLTVAHGQTTFNSLVDTNSSWSYYNDYSFGFSYGWSTYYYFFKGDTTINSVSYKKLYRQDSTMGAIYQGGLTEDSLTKKVYMNQSGNVFLLYNFSANVGDTVMTIGFGMGQPAIVDKIDSIQLQDGTYRKLFHSITSGVSPLDSFAFYTIDGIGNLQELLGLNYTEQSWTILCYKYNDSLQFINPFKNACHVPTFNNTGISEYNSSFTISINPNPFSTQTTLQIDPVGNLSNGAGIPLHNATLTIYNSFGQAVKQIKNISGQTVTLTRDNLPGGLYFFRITQDNKTITTDKLVITDN
ncbi:MAG: T9SS type A sorting domain-containing protein [Bacteroidetes bacterium]|nr:T9SS type A sorting domain-containing protein [Bacteroidota bacterium]